MITTSPDKQAIRAAMVGRWHELHARLIPKWPRPCDKSTGIPCPSCGGNDRFSLFTDYHDTGARIADNAGQTRMVSRH